LDYVKDALRACRAIPLHWECSRLGPLKLTFQAADGVRAGILVYEFEALVHDGDDSTIGRGPRPSHSGGRGSTVVLEQDPAGLYMTLLLSVDPKSGIFIGADPVLHSPMRRRMQIPYSKQHAATIFAKGWEVWERDPHEEQGFGPIEVLVGFKKEQFLRYVFFERDALGEDAGHRYLLAERWFTPGRR
jgi:hypothetical protein